MNWLLVSPNKVEDIIIHHDLGESSPGFALSSALGRAMLVLKSVGAEDRKFPQCVP